ncbi:MAG TPA: prolyl oligopeptidase family serine peptidase [Ignavibacteriaceae bacterium]|nr:MAG: Prolyl endopeptidase [Ignavibacteria bacterium ADurb.Bin266]OQY71196.1 MAG: S9 family peptidase [Ignavibacteriales bacterium UTCHB2]HQF41308.1 prolyl oligopeptidase family serine peptidase [Ignavibacteriaceae bacterium]HQI40337.1 prolyl oligopeptidase family serine peptidase [Ignavibacteriaceae bacterium]
MKNIIGVILILTIMYGCSQQLKYPETKKVDVVDDYFGTKVADPYRWLEDDNSPETAEWVKEENNVTNEYLSKIPFRDKLKKRFEELYNYPKYSAPFRAGSKYYFFKNAGLQNQSVMYVKDNLDSEPKLFFDPNKLSEDGTVSLSALSFSKDGKLFAYGTASGGSDWNEFFVMDAESGKLLSDHLKWIKFSGMAWKDDGFFYSRYPEPTGSELSTKNQYSKVYYHKIGDDQSKDVVIFEDASKPDRGFSAGTTDDERFLIISFSEGTSNNGFLVKDLSTPGSRFISIVDDLNNNYGVVDNLGDKLLVLTDYKAPNYRLILIDPKNPARANWKDVIPESKNVLQNVKIIGGKLFATYMQDAANHVYVYDLNGKYESEIEMPALGSVSLSGRREDNIAFYSFTSFTYPGAIYKLDVSSGKSELYLKVDLNFDFDNYETKQVFYESKDGTKVPMFIVYKKGLKLDGNNPAYLYSYGGFNISLNPSFSAARLMFLENGGVYAMPNIRGGGEYGEEWHKAGMLDKKQNVFDDFISAAEYLINEGYTNPSKLACAGGSNGGLLIGAVINQRPDLFKVAIPQVGVMDMLRFHKFTIGHHWAVEYGSSDNEEQFNYLYKYSPLHNINGELNYPAVLVTTADHDDRVVPAHSFKYIATLQEKYKGENPVLIRIETKAGHGAGKPTSKVIEEVADLWSFVFYNLKMTPKY